MRTAKALARLRGCAGLPEPSLFAYAIKTIISWAESNTVLGIFIWYTICWRKYHHFNNLNYNIYILNKERNRTCTFQSVLALSETPYMFILMTKYRNYFETENKYCDKNDTMFIVQTIQNRNKNRQCCWESCLKEECYLFLVSPREKVLFTQANSEDICAAAADPSLLALTIYEPRHEKICLMPYTNNKSADQPAYLRLYYSLPG